jgi:hypothetical protein
VIAVDRAGARLLRLRGLHAGRQRSKQPDWSYRGWDLVPVRLVVLTIEEAAVECWIGITTEGERRIVRVAGRLSVAHVPEMLEACTNHVPLAIDLTDLVSADLAGIEALQRLRSNGASILGAPGYIQLKLDLPSGIAAGIMPPRSRRS